MARNAMEESTIDERERKKNAAKILEDSFVTNVFSISEMSFVRTQLFRKTRTHPTAGRPPAQFANNRWMLLTVVSYIHNRGRR
jgi:hypothetical protein